METYQCWRYSFELVSKQGFRGGDSGRRGRGSGDGKTEVVSTSLREVLLSFRELGLRDGRCRDNEET